MVFLQQAIVAQVDSSFLKYKTLNDNEYRLLDYKDSDDDLLLKIKQLEFINRSRRQYKMSPVQLDILACRLANQNSKEAALYKYLGHYNLAGAKPYQRYAAIGGKDHITENTAGYWSSEQIPKDSAATSRKIAEMHRSFMTELPPNDGHKKTCIDPAHNYVGIGFFNSGNDFRYYEEYIDRYLVFVNAPDTVSIGEEFKLLVKPAAKQYLYAMLVYWEKTPRPMTAAAISKIKTYADFSPNIENELWTNEMAQFRKGEVYEIPLRFAKAGMYYVHLYQDNKEYLQAPKRASTKDKLQASGLLIVVR